MKSNKKYYEELDHYMIMLNTMKEDLKIKQKPKSKKN